MKLCACCTLVWRWQLVCTTEHKREAKLHACLKNVGISASLFVFFSICRVCKGPVKTVERQDLSPSPSELERHWSLGQPQLSEPRWGYQNPQSRILKETSRTVRATYAAFINNIMSLVARLRRKVSSLT